MSRNLKALIASNEVPNNPNPTNFPWEKSVPAISSSLTPSQIQEMHANSAPSLSPSQIAEMHANSLNSPASGSNFTNPFSFQGPGLMGNMLNFGKEVGSAAINPQTYINTGKNAAVGLGTLGQDLMKMLWTHPSSQEPISEFSGILPKVVSATSKKIAPIENAPIAYDVNASTSPANKFAQGAFHSLPLAAVPLGELDAPAITGGMMASGTINTAINPQQSKLKSYLEGAIPFGVAAGLTKGAALAGKYLFARSGQPVDQLQRELSQIYQDKSEYMQTLKDTPIAMDNTPSGQIAQINQSEFPGEYQNALSNVAGQGNDLGDAVSSLNQTGKVIGNEAYGDAAKYDDNEVNQAVLNAAVNPEQYENMDNWDLSKDLTSEELMEMMPDQIQQHFKDTFPSPQTSELNSDMLYGAGNNLSGNKLSASMEKQIRAAYGLDKSSDLMPGIKPQDLINSLPTGTKSQALKILQGNGGAALNMRSVVKNNLPSDMQSDFEKIVPKTIGSPNTIGRVKSYRRQVNAAMNSDNPVLKNGLLKNISGVLKHKVILPAQKYYDDALGIDPKAGVAAAQQNADMWHSSVVAPFNDSTPEMAKLANNTMIDPHPERVEPVLKKALEKVNYVQHQFNDDVKSPLYNPKIPKDHVLRKLHNQVKSLMAFRSNPELRALSEGRFFGTKQDQVKAFEKAIKDGDLPLHSPIVKKYYEPLKKQMDLEKGTIKQSELNKKAELSEAQRLQKSLRQHPGLIKQALMDYGRGLQYAAPLARIAKPIYYANANKPK